MGNIQEARAVKMAKLDSATTAIIVRDIAANVAPKNSKITYNKEALEFRKKVKKEWLAWKKAHPGARLSVPNDIEGIA